MTPRADRDTDRATSGAPGLRRHSPGRRIEVITKFASEPNGRRLVFWCPGCEEPHMPTIEGAAPWAWNGNREKPTLTPSILVTDGSGNRCHSFVTDGEIRFLDDCTHALKGQTVALPPWPYDEDKFGGLDTEPTPPAGGSRG